MCNNDLVKNLVKISAYAGVITLTAYALNKLVQTIQAEKQYKNENALTQYAFNDAYKLLDDYETNIRIMNRNLIDGNGSKPVFTPQQAFERAIVNNPIQSDDPAYMFAFKAIERDYKNQDATAVKAMSILKTWDEHENMDGPVSYDELMNRLEA